jgi:hypothetical protein
MPRPFRPSRFDYSMSNCTWWRVQNTCLHDFFPIIADRRDTFNEKRGQSFGTKHSLILPNWHGLIASDISDAYRMFVRTEMQGEESLPFMLRKQLLSEQRLVVRLGSGTLRRRAHTNAFFHPLNWLPILFSLYLDNGLTTVRFRPGVHFESYITRWKETRKKRKTMYIHTHIHKVFQKELYSGVTNVTVWRVLLKRLHLRAYNLDSC